MKQLRLLTMAVCALLMSSTALAQEDITSQYLTNADLSTKDGGWQNGGYTAWVTDGAVPVVEFWNWSNQFSFTQSITLPKGEYRLAVNSFYRESWGGDGTNNDMAWIFAGETTQNVVALSGMSELSQYSGSNDLYKAATAFSKGKYSNEFDFTIDDDNTEIEIGFKGTTPNGGWCILGPVKLYKYDKDAYLADYKTKVAEAQELLKKPMNADVKAALEATLVDESTLTTTAKIKDQIKLINEAIAAAEVSIAIYEEINAYLEYTQGNVAGDYSAITTKISNGAYVESEPAIVEIKNVRNGIIFKSSTPDMSKLIDNAGFELGNTNYWTVGNSTDTGARSTTNGTYAMSNSEGDYLFNTWWQGIPITQNVGKLPKGQYVLSAVVASDGARIYGKINDAHDYYVDTNDKAVGLPFNYVFTLDEEKEVTIGVVGSNDDEGKTYTEAGYFWYKADNFKLTKYVPVTAINAEDVTVEVYETASITATVIPDNASLPEITYTSGNDEIATVDADGVVTGVAVGSTTITLTADGVSTTINVTVKAPAVLPQSITLNPDALTFKFGENTTAQIIATVSPSEANQEVTFASSDESVATVDQDGNVTATGIGTATITVTSKVKESVTATASVSVSTADAPKVFASEIVNKKDYWFRNAATGKYLGGANSWGTRASLIKHGIPFNAGKVSDGVYTLDSYTNNGGDSHYVNGEWIDQGATNLIFTKNANGTFSIGLTVTTTDEETGVTSNNTAYLKANVSDGLVYANGATPGDPFAQWYAISIDDQVEMLKNGTATDATCFIKDYNFSRNNQQYSSWIKETSGKFNNAQNGSNEHFNWNMECYCAPFSATQILGLPNGTYKLTAQGFYRKDGPDDENLPMFFANDQEVTFPEINGSENNMHQAAVSFSADKYYSQPITVEVTDHTLKIGAKCESSSYWCIWDNFELELVAFSKSQELPITIGETGYATLYYSNVNLANSQATPYAVTVDGNKAVLTELPSDDNSNAVIPAGTPVVLEGNPGTCSFIVPTYDNLADETPAIENELAGTDEETYISEEGYKYYVLSQGKSGNLGFYYQTAGGASVTNAAHKAYLKKAEQTDDGEAGAAEFYLIFDSLNGISNTTVSTEGNKEVYTISGVRVNGQLQKGVYIMNGKKVIIK